MEPLYNIEQTDPKKFIIIKGAKVNNLKNISLAIPRNRLIIITGLSGSGKSSLAFDTLYAEGQRRYVESLSSYARQFLGRMSKPEVEYIKGIAPAVAIEQKVITRNPRSTVGTSTEIYEYIKLLFARIGQTISPISNESVKRHSVTDIVNYIMEQKTGSKVMILCPLLLTNNRDLIEQLTVLMQQGFTRICQLGEIIRMDEVISKEKVIRSKKDLFIVIDRIMVQEDDHELASRIADSIQTAFYEGNGQCIIDIIDQDTTRRKEFSNLFELDGIAFEEPSVNLFSFNNPYGACKNCEGYGSVIGIDEDLVIPDKSRSVYENAIVCWKGDKMSEWKDKLVMNAEKFGFPIHKPIYDLTPEQYELLWNGNEHFFGLHEFFAHLEQNAYKIQYRVMLSRYRGKTICPECKGTRLRKDANYVKIDHHSISDLVMMPVDDLRNFFLTINLDAHNKKVAERLLTEIRNRLEFLSNVGLGYLNMNRLSNTLSGGESQRINLATSLGSSLVGSMYILDEPSIGLHPRDTQRLITVLKRLRNIGNTVIVVEHEEEIIREADEIIDIGPLAGTNGGELVFQGDLEAILKDTNSLTGKYLSGSLSVSTPTIRRNWNQSIEIQGARENNLKNIDVQFPLNTLTVITGVSGSGKTTLIKQVLYPALKKIHGGYGEKTGKMDRLSGDINAISSVEMIDQNPIGRSSRSNPATYVKAYDEIRALFAEQALAKSRHYKPGYFSFNVAGGRCEACEGEGHVKIAMQFMADIVLPCETCGGTRFKEEVLDVKFEGKNIHDILNMTIEDAIDFFELHQTKSSSVNRIINRLKPLKEVGLGYIKMGQSSSTLSGGEAQRIKLAYFLTMGSNEKPTLFIFDEPTTGLHFHDINKLLGAFYALLDKGHSIIVIEHNMEIIKSADWVIDLGPEGGQHGGTLVFAGTPENLASCQDSYTGNYLRHHLPA